MAPVDTHQRRRFAPTPVRGVREAAFGRPWPVFGGLGPGPVVSDEPPVAIAEPPVVSAEPLRSVVNHLRSVLNLHISLFVSFCCRKLSLSHLATQLEPGFRVVFRLPCPSCPLSRCVCKAMHGHVCCARSTPGLLPLH